MTNFYEGILTNTPKAIEGLKANPKNGFPLILQAIQHPDERVRLKFISSFYHPVVKGLYLQDKDKQQQILDLLISRYDQETNTAIQIAIIQCFVYFCIVNAKSEIFRPIQISALHHANYDIVNKALEWCLHYYSETVSEVLTEIIKTHPDQEIRGRALVVELYRHPDGDYPFDAKLFFPVLEKSDYTWQTYARHAIKYVKTEEDILHLFEVVNLPGLGGVTRNDIVAYLGEIVPTLEESSQAHQLYDERYSPFGVLSKMLKTQVNQPLLHADTWEKAVEAISQGTTNFYDVGWQLYAKVHRRDKIQTLYDEAIQRADTTVAARIQSSYERLLGQIDVYNR
jgi:hypothetical protein